MIVGKTAAGDGSQATDGYLLDVHGDNERQGDGRRFQASFPRATSGTTPDLLGASKGCFATASETVCVGRLARRQYWTVRRATRVFLRFALSIPA